MRVILFISIATLMFRHHSEAQTSSAPIFIEQDQDLFDIPQDPEYSFGYLHVLEDRSDSNSRIIRLPVYIFKSRSKTPKPDPIVYTVGGPGSSSMPSAQYMKYYQYLDDRNLILIEQRGTRYAEPALNCPEWSRAVYLSNFPDCGPECSDSLLENASLKCQQRLSQMENINTAKYTTVDIAADINDLMELLDIEQYNLLTISYSTKISQVLLRDYPERIRSVVMDSPLPLEANYDEESVSNLLASLNQMLLDCEADSSCNTNFPHLSERLHEFLIASNNSPVEVYVYNPVTNNDEKFLLKGADIVGMISEFLSNTGYIPNLPLEINKMLDGDYSTIKSLLQQLLAEPASYDGYGIGMRLAVWCQEEAVFIDYNVVRSEEHNHAEVFGLRPSVFPEEVCRVWTVKPAFQIENEPVYSDIPVLIINGAYDPITPVSWGNQLATNLPNSYHIVFDRWGHTPTTYWSNPCAMKLATVFFNDPHSRPGLECQEVKSVEFTTQP
ncbi:MAG: alpha/beta fold hydrolase [Oceanospirillaceae bacterium]|nr:alpha/beta fold hydrolase [Oceanospirillaceae bacterium]